MSAVTRPAIWADDALELGQDEAVVSLDRAATAEEFPRWPTGPGAPSWRVQVVPVAWLNRVQLRASGALDPKGNPAVFQSVDGLLVRNYYMDGGRH